jgi:hypothetical protein
MQIIRAPGIIEGGHVRVAKLRLNSRTRIKNPRVVTAISTTDFTRVVCQTQQRCPQVDGGDARGPRGAGLKTAATTAKRREPSCREGKFEFYSGAGDASDAEYGHF